MKAYIGVDDRSGLGHTVISTAKTSDMSQFGDLLHGDEERLSADRGQAIHRSMRDLKRT